VAAVPSDPIPAIFAKTNTTFLEAKPHGIEFTYPDSGNMATLVNRVLRGGEYPFLNLPGYAPRLVIDIGANVGAAAVYFAVRYPSAEVHCYEPSSHNLAFLARNSAELPRIHCHPFGLHDRELAIDLFLGASQSMQCSVVASVETGGQTERVTLRRARTELAAIGLAGGAAVLKLDTEGCELPILRDLGDLLGGVDLIYVEYHSEADRRAIDGLLADRFMLATANAHYPHRGLNLYVAETLAATFPALHALRLEATPPTP
jgi:FkbM family methyltransferase